VQQDSNVRLGYLYAFLAALCGGAIPTLSKLSLEQNGPVQVSGVSFLLSGLLLMFIRPKEFPNSKSLKYVVFFGFLGAALAPLLYQTGIDSTTAVNTSLLSNGEALFTTLIAFAAFGERLPGKQLARGLLIVAGIVAVSTNLDLAGVQFFQGLAGNLLILGAMFCWSLENNLIINSTRRFGPVLVSKFRNILGGAMVLGVSVAMGLQFVTSGYAVVYLLLLAVSLAGTSFLAIAALGYIGAIRAILVFSTSTIFGAVFALVVLREQVTVVQVAGGAMILLGVYLLQRAERNVPIPAMAEKAQVG